MKKVFTLAVVLTFSAGALMAQSTEKVSATRSTVVKSKDALQSATPDLSKEEIEAIKQRASKATRISSMETEEQRKARLEEKRKNLPATSKTKTDDN